MAPRHRLPAIMAMLTLAAALSPLASAQETQGAIVVSTDAASYPPGGTVLFTLRNQGSFNVSVGEFQVIANAGIVATFTPALSTIPPGGGASFDWKSFVNGAAAPAGDYWGILKVTEQRVVCGSTCYTYPWTYSIHVNGKAQASAEAAWVIQAQAQPAPSPPAAPAQGRLVVGAAPDPARLGERVSIVLANRGGAALLANDACQVGFQVRWRVSSLVLYDSSPGPVCAQMEQRLDAGANLTLTWDQRTSEGDQVPPSEYVVRARFGAASAEAALRIEAPQNASQPEVRRLALRAQEEPIHPWVRVTLALTNEGNVALEGAVRLEVRDANATLVHANASAAMAALGPGQSVLLSWDQRTDAGLQAGAGTYEARASLAGIEARARFALLGGAPPPFTPAEPPQAQPAPEEKPVVGRIEASANAGLGASCFEGDWVRFCLDASARLLKDFSADGRVVVKAMLVPGSGPITVTSEPGAIVLRTQGSTVTVYDAPAGSLRLEAASGSASVQLQLADSVSATTAEGSATLRAPGFEALLLMQGRGGVSGGAQQLTVSLQGAEGQAPGFVLRAMPPQAPASAPPPQVTLTDPALVRAALDAALPRVIADMKVAAEAYIAREGAEVKTSVVPYVAADVRVSVAEASAKALTIDFEVDQPEGRVLVFHLGEGVLVDTRAGFRVLYDGQPIAMASSLADVLDPDDDGLAAEYVLVQGSAGAELVVSVPHFSPHSLSVQSLAAVQALAPYGAVAGFAVMAAAAVYMLRRSKQ